MPQSVTIPPRATSAARIENRIAELKAKARTSPEDATTCKRHARALTKLLKHPRADYTLGYALGKAKIIGGGGQRALLGDVEWSDPNKKRTPKKSKNAADAKSKNRGPRTPRPAKSQ